MLSKSDDEFVTEVQGAKILATKVTSRQLENNVWVGVRPEKIALLPPGGTIADTSRTVNTLPGGRVTDVSFVGVSTQYVVRMPWGQELMVFEQNTGERQQFRRGDTVDLTWSPEYTFLLDAAQDAHAGADLGDDE